MNNISWSRDLVNKDNGERVMHWIPCSSRLPSEDGKYLITIIGNKVIETEFNNGVFSPHEESVLNFNSNTIAWMKLPKPYKK